MHDQCTDGGLSCYNTAGPTDFCLSVGHQTAIHMCHVWMHVMALKHLWWLRWSDMKRSAWSSKGSSDDNSRASFIGKSKNIEAVSFVWTFDENASRLKVMPSFHFYICPSSAFFLMFTLCFVFMWMLNCTRGNKGHEKWSLFCLKHQKLWIRQLYISYLASYLCSEQKKETTVSRYYAPASTSWTKQTH